MDIQKMMKQAQDMQNNIAKIKNEIEASKFSATKSGAVTVTMFGSKIVESIEINKELLNESEKELLEDIIVLAFNDCVQQIESFTKERLGAYSGILDSMGGLF